MKNLKLTIILICNLLLAISNVQAQAPEKINYQAVARNLAGVPLVNQTINVKYEIRQGTSTGAVVYAESHSLTTNQFGLFTAEIGGGTPISGTFPGIAWGTSPFYLFVEVDGDAMGVTQLLSVPYALYAKESANGPAGLPGKNSLSLSTPYTGPACVNGGTQVDAGLDDNNDGTLQPLEIDYTYVICNGTNGSNGTNGLPGTNGIDGVSIDSTINNNDGTFTIYYSNSTSFTTSDLTGPAGTNGTSGTTYFAGNGISLSGDTITNLGDLDNNPTNELQLLSVSNDTIFLSNGGFAPLPNAGGFWTQLGGSIHNNNVGNVGIGTTTPLHQLSVASNDSVVASFLGTDPNVAAIVVGNVNASAATGIVFFNGVDTTSYIFLTPTTNSLTIRNNSINGNILISTDSIIVNQGLILVNQAQNSIYNEADTIYSYSPSGKIVNVNQGMFLTDSLYVLGNNLTNTNWVLANDGFGQAKWTDPSTIVGSVGDNWGFQTVVTDTSLVGDGAGTPLSVNPNIIPTQTSQLTNNSGFITSPNDADTSVTNELQVLSFSNDTLYLSNGNAIYLPPAAGDSWGSDSVITAGANISGSGTSTNPLMVLDNDTSATNELQVLSFANDTLYLSNGNAVYLPPAVGDSWGTQTVNVDNTTIFGDGDVTPLSGFDGQYSNLTGVPTNVSTFINDAGYITTFTEVDADTTNELQALSFVDPILTLSKGGGSVNLSTLSGTAYTAGTGINLTGDTITNTAPDQTVVITGAGTTSITSSYPSFIITTTDNDTSATNEIQSLSSTTSPGTVTVDITGGTGTTFSIDDADANPANELITSFAVNGTSDSLVIMEGINNYKAVPLTSLAGAANAWNLTGNAGTVDGTNFIGTTDAIPFNIRVNNQKSGSIELNGTTANTFFGYRAGQVNTGIYNSGFGFEALLQNTSGNYNTAIGYDVLHSNTIGNYNTAVGIAALYNNSTGLSNTAIGGSALNGNTTGNYNTAIGDRSLQNVGKASNNTAVGYGTLINNSNAGQNVAIGSQALYSQSFTNGGTAYVTDNVAVGYQALYSNQPTGSGTDALRNIAVGSLVLYSNTTGLENTAIGHSALSSNNTGLRNTANGAWALYSNTTGSFNVAFGYLAGVTFTGANANTTGNNNTFIGYASGPGTSIQLTNATAIGANAIVNQSNSLVLGNNANVGIGTGSPSAKLHLNGTLRLENMSGITPVNGYVLTAMDAQGNAEWAPPSGAANAWNLTGNTGTVDGTNFIGTTDNVALNFRINNTKAGRIDSTNNEVAFGYNALLSNTSGAQITAIGTNALKQHTTGTENTAVGYNTLANVTTTYGNTAIGSRALSSVTTNGNSAVGYGALELNSVGSNNTAMGMFSLRESTSGSNAAFGYYSLAFNTSGGNNTAMGYNVFGSNTTGSNNTAVGYNSGATNISGSNNTFIGADADATVGNLINATAIGFNAKVAQNNSLILGNGANVGIGTTTPIEDLSIHGSTPFVWLQDNDNAGNTAVGGFVIRDQAGSGVTSYDYQGAQARLISWIAGSNISFLNNTGSGTATRMTISGANGFVGIGTPAPSAKLDVQNIDDNVHAFSSIHTGTNAHAGYFQINNAANNLNAINATTNGAGAAINASNTYSGVNAVRDGIYVTATGAGGAGTVNKAAYFSASGASNNYAAIFDQGNVGIGTNSPSTTLDVANSTQPTTSRFVNTFTGASNTAVYGWTTGAGTGINYGGSFESTGSPTNYGVYGNSYGTGTSNYGVYGTATGTGAGTNFAGYFSASGATNNYAIVVPSTGGNVGIGTTAPTAKLHIGGVAGTDGIRFPDGTLQTTAAAGSSGWNLTGNAGTVDGTDFMGTTDNVAINFRVNNQKVGRIESNTWTGGNFVNTFFGYLTGNSNTTGSENTASGAYSLYSNTTGNLNTASGLYSLYSNTTGIENTASGNSSLFSNVAGNNATAIGSYAMYYANNNPIAFTNYNVAVGYEALRGSVTPASNTGNTNTAIGYQSLMNNTGGSGNTAIGYGTLINNTSSTGNTVLGYGAGSAFINGNNNTFIGYNTGASANGFTNATAIGANAIVSQNNSLILGNNANVGIGTATPTYPLHVVGTTPASNILAYFDYSGAATGTIIGAYSSVNSSGTGDAKGITGNAAATGASNNAFGGEFLAQGGGSGFKIGVDAYANSSGGSGPNYGIRGFANGTTTGQNYGVYGSASNGATNWAGYFANGNVYVQNNMGIGTSTPTAKLDVNGSIVISGANTNELNRAQTGTANLVPIAYGTTNSGGAIDNAGTGNWSVVRLGLGNYQITITGESVTGSSHLVHLTKFGSAGTIYYQAPLGNIIVYTYNNAGALTDSFFNFIVYKP